jgi:hypothetical protein
MGFIWVLWVLTYLGGTVATPRIAYVTCITIIDTIILTNYTNDAYYYDTIRTWVVQ